MKEEQGLIFDITPYMIEDGPGIRTNVFFKGCPLNCKWCSNPYGLKKHSEIIFAKNRCTSCGKCIKVCDSGAISFDQKGTIAMDFSKCTNCGNCISVCFSKALSIVGKYYTVNEVYEILDRDRAYFRRGNGGITVSGGEIILQANFVSKLLKKCSDEGIHTTIETSAFGSWEKLKAILEYTYVAFIDLKCIDDNKHKELTGVSNKLILDNINKAAELCYSKNKILIIRMPVIPTLNDYDENIVNTANFVKSLPGNVELNVLPYHNYGINKYENIGSNYELEDLEPQSKNDLKHIESLLSSLDFKFSIGGHNVVSYD